MHASAIELESNMEEFQMAFQYTIEFLTAGIGGVVRYFSRASHAVACVHANRNSKRT